MRERALQIAFATLTVALLGVAAASVYGAMELRFVYQEDIRLAFYPTLATGLAPVLGAAVVALLVAGHVLRNRVVRLEHGLLRWMDAQGGWMPSEWDDDVELGLVQGVQTGQFGYQGAEVQVALAERRALLRRQRWAARLLGVPVTGLAAVVGFSLWAVPASGAFLESQALLNTTLVFFASYGLFVILTGLVVALLLAFGE